MYFIYLLLSFLHLNLSDPIDSCSKQSSCLYVDIYDCDDLNNREVCLSWIPNQECLKASDLDTTETISHSCAGEDGTKDYDNDGSELWGANTKICQTVIGGESAIFGIKDGRGCSETGSYFLNGLSDSVSCNGPLNICDGNNNKECSWTIPTDVCSNTGKFCPSKLICDVPIPCSVLTDDDIECSCTEYRFTHN